MSNCADGVSLWPALPSVDSRSVKSDSEPNEESEICCQSSPHSVSVLIDGLWSVKKQAGQSMDCIYEERICRGVPAEDAIQFLVCTPHI